MRLQTPEHIRTKDPAPAQLAPIPAPGRVLHRRAVEHELMQSWRAAIDADDMRDTRTRSHTAARLAHWPTLAHNPAQMTLF